MFPTLIFDGERIAPETLAERAERAASGFAALGVVEGDVIAAMLRNEPAYLEAMYCGARAGRVPVSDQLALSRRRGWLHPA